MTIQCPNIGIISGGGVDVMSLDATLPLDGETISSLTVTEVSTTQLTLSSAAVKGSTWTSKYGIGVAASKGVQVSVTASTVAGEYAVKWTLTTSGSRTLPIETKLLIV